MESERQGTRTANSTKRAVICTWTEPGSRLRGSRRQAVQQRLTSWVGLVPRLSWENTISRTWLVFLDASADSTSLRSHSSTSYLSPLIPFFHYVMLLALTWLPLPVISSVATVTMRQKYMFTPQAKVMFLYKHVRKMQLPYKKTRMASFSIQRTWPYGFCTRIESCSSPIGFHSSSLLYSNCILGQSSLPP